MLQHPACPVYSPAEILRHSTAPGGESDCQGQRRAGIGLESRNRSGWKRKPRSLSPATPSAHPCPQVPHPSRGGRSSPALGRGFWGGLTPSRLRGQSSALGSCRQGLVRTRWAGQGCSPSDVTHFRLIPLLPVPVLCPLRLWDPRCHRHRRGSAVSRVPVVWKVLRVAGWVTAIRGWGGWGSLGRAPARLSVRTEPTRTRPCSSAPRDAQGGSLCRAGPFLGHGRGCARGAGAGAKVPFALLVSGTEPERGRRIRTRGSEVGGGGAGRCLCPLRAQSTAWCHRRVTAGRAGQPRPPGGAATPGSSPMCWGGHGVGGIEEPQPPTVCPQEGPWGGGWPGWGAGGGCLWLVWGTPR